MKTVNKNQWIVDDNDFSDATMKVVATITEERNLVEVNDNTGEMRFKYEWIPVEMVRVLLREYDLMTQDKVELKQQGDEAYEFKTSNDNS